MNRGSGIIMHIASLPGKYGIGTFGKEAYEFGDFLKKAEQKYWQILPLGQTSYGDSPYQSFSAFAGNPYFIDFDILQQDGLLEKEDYCNVNFGNNSEVIDYAIVFIEKMKVLRKAYKNFKRNKLKDLEDFEREEAFWLDDYALYMSVKSTFNLKSWQFWDNDIRLRKEEAITRYKKEFSDEIAYWKFLQYEFFKQWNALKNYVNKLGVEIIGDIPIYVAEDSADVWSNPQAFLLDKKTLKPLKVAGCPPDIFSETGQLWGNPIYDWKYIEKTGYRWWVDRIKQSLKIYDVLRIDHFKGFESYWSIPAGDKTAEFGEWVKGPGIKIFDAIKNELGDVNIIAEDLGTLTEDTIKLRNNTGFPGMKILEFAFDSDSDNPFLPHNYEKNFIAYTGTHDNDTVRGWIETTGGKKQVEKAIEYLSLNKEEGYNWGFIRGIWSSVANVAIAQMQDFLNLGNETRINLPSTIGENWRWRAKEDVFTDELASRIYKLTKTYGRCKEAMNKQVLNKEAMKKGINRYLKVKYGVKIDDAKEYQIFNAVSLTVLENIIDDWNETTELYNNKGRQAYYLSAEFLMGRALGNNLMNLGIYDEVKEVLEELNIDINKIEEIEEDAGLGNGGLGRLAACFIESAATINMPLMGYGIRYNNGLFNQNIENGFQTECEDNWLKYGEPWSIRKDNEAQIIEYADMKVKAIPYDTPIIGYGTRNINTLRLWKCEAIREFDFNLFNDQKYAEAIEAKNNAEDISRVLYPNDSNDEGKILRLRQQYFFSSASLKDIIKKHKARFGNDFTEFTKYNVMQLNDTHPTIAIPELIRLLIDVEGLKFEEALYITKKVFAYTNHTILAEALEKWDIRLIEKLFPRILEIVEMIDETLISELKEKKFSKEEIENFRIIKTYRHIEKEQLIQKGKAVKNEKVIENKLMRMANLAIYVGIAVNGVAAIHTEILKNTELNNWYKLYPKKFQNKTNGITPRRWLRLCNAELSAFITDLLESEDWVKNLELLEGLKKFQDDDTVLEKLMSIKHEKKVQLADYIKQEEGITVDPNSFFDIQIKRLHEYKRQFLNAIYILDLYYRLKEDPNLDIPKTTFIFGAKAFPGYRRAKAIIKFITQIGNLIDNDKDVAEKIKVVFVHNYRVSYAQKLFPGSDLSKQISTAGKEASGTGNMKFMLNATPTFGTLDGANVEIVQESGKENNFIFGLKVEDIEKIKDSYDPKKYYEKNLSIKRTLDTLIDGTFDDGGSGDFKDLYNSLLEEGDQYYLLADFDLFKEEEEKVFEAYKNKKSWAKKCFANLCNAGVFSSDRTIKQYANEIWNIKATPIE